MNDYQRIIDYDFSDTVLDDKLVVKFKLKKTFRGWSGNKFTRAYNQYPVY